MEPVQRQGGAATVADALSQRLAFLETAAGSVVATQTDYPDAHAIPSHRHSRSQLLFALRGVVLVSTPKGRWMVPAGHAIWLPAQTSHSVDMLGKVSMLSAYVLPDAVGGLPRALRVVAMTNLVRSLMVETVSLDPSGPETARAELVRRLLVHEIPLLPELPLGLPLPVEPRLAALCRRFLQSPSASVRIEDWAGQMGMSRRTFTRAFRRETGLGLSAWRQQACLFAALPRLSEGQPVTSVALDLGYDSVPAFTTMFRRMLGSAPRTYLRAARESAAV